MIKDNNIKPGDMLYFYRGLKREPPRQIAISSVVKNQFGLPYCVTFQEQQGDRLATNFLFDQYTCFLFRSLDEAMATSKEEIKTKVREMNRTYWEMTKSLKREWRKAIKNKTTKTFKTGYMTIRKINSINELKEAAKGGGEFFISLGAAKSSKHIHYAETEKLFYVSNYIDGSEAVLNEEELGTMSNIAEAIKKGAFFQEDYN